MGLNASVCSIGVWTVMSGIGLGGDGVSQRRGVQYRWQKTPQSHREHFAFCHSEHFVSQHRLREECSPLKKILRSSFLKEGLSQKDMMWRLSWE